MFAFICTHHIIGWKQKQNLPGDWIDTGYASSSPVAPGCLGRVSPPSSGRMVSSVTTWCLLAWLMRTRPVSRVLRGFNSLFSHRLEQRHSCGKNICLQGLGGLVNLNERAYICPKLCYKEVIVVVSPLATVYSVKHCLQVWWWCRCCPHPISVST